MSDHMTNKKPATLYYLKRYIPKVYQENIYAIDYEKLKEKGIELITFDVDDTIIPSGKTNPSKDAINLFTGLRHELKFRVMLVSNSKDEKKVQRIAKKLGAERYVAKAEKPDPKYFEEIIDYCQLKKNQIAHVGNSIMNDVGCANSLQITSCLVRPVAHEGDIVPELEEQKLWRKHHKEQEGDQYYQLGETQKN